PTGRSGTLRRPRTPTPSATATSSAACSSAASTSRRPSSRPCSSRRLTVRPRWNARSRRQGSSLAASASSLWETIAVEAGRESELWAAALRPESEREEQAVFSPLAEERFAVGLETIYEGDRKS